MPIYSYHCPSCGHAEERIVRDAEARDKQTCIRLIASLVNADLMPSQQEQPCGARLQRDGIEQVALMRHFWMP